MPPFGLLGGGVSAHSRLDWSWHWTCSDSDWVAEHTVDSLRVGDNVDRLGHAVEAIGRARGLFLENRIQEAESFLGTAAYCVRLAAADMSEERGWELAVFELETAQDRLTAGGIDPGDRIFLASCSLGMGAAELVRAIVASEPSEALTSVLSRMEEIVRRARLLGVTEVAEALKDLPAAL